jgi:hypothetical protein
LSIRGECSVQIKPETAKNTGTSGTTPKNPNDFYAVARSSRSFHFARLLEQVEQRQKMISMLCGTFQPFAPLCVPENPSRTTTDQITNPKTPAAKF